MSFMLKGVQIFITVLSLYHIKRYSQWSKMSRHSNLSEMNSKTSLKVNFEDIS